jgi:hypothetical protein
LGGAQDKPDLIDVALALALGFWTIGLLIALWTAFPTLRYWDAPPT